MIYTAIIFGLLTLAAGMAVAYRNKTLNEQQTHKAYSKVRII